MEAAKALGRAGVGARAIRDRIGVEKNELVLTDLTEALLSAGDLASVDLLKVLASTHGSALVRAYASMAVADLVEGDSLPFLRLRLKNEGSRRVKATLLGLLFVYGADDVLGELLRGLRSRDAAIRGKIANMLAYYLPRRKRREILSALDAAARIETTTGNRERLEAAIKALGRRRQ